MGSEGRIWFRAIAYGDTSLVAEQVPVMRRTCNQWGETGLMVAAKCNLPEIAEILAPHEAGAMNVEGRTALMYAAVANAPEICRLLLPMEKGILTMDARNALMFAASANSAAAAQVLAEELNLARDAVGRTPLHYAVIANALDVAAILLEVDGLLTPEDFDLLIEHSRDSGYEEMLALLERYRPAPLIRSVDTDSIMYLYDLRQAIDRLPTSATTERIVKSLQCLERSVRSDLDARTKQVDNYNREIYKLRETLAAMRNRIISLEAELESLRHVTRSGIGAAAAAAANTSDPRPELAVLLAQELMLRSRTPSTQTTPMAERKPPRRDNCVDILVPSEAGAHPVPPDEAEGDEYVYDMSQDDRQITEIGGTLGPLMTSTNVTMHYVDESAEDPAPNLTELESVEGLNIKNASQSGIMETGLEVQVVGTDGAEALDAEGVYHGEAASIVRAPMPVAGTDNEKDRLQPSVPRTPQREQQVDGQAAFDGNATGEIDLETEERQKQAYYALLAEVDDSAYRGIDNPLVLSLDSIELAEGRGLSVGPPPVSDSEVLARLPPPAYQQDSMDPESNYEPEGIVSSLQTHDIPEPALDCAALEIPVSIAPVYDPEPQEPTDSLAPHIAVMSELTDSTFDASITAAQQQPANDPVVATLSDGQTEPSTNNDPSTIVHTMAQPAKPVSYDCFNPTSLIVCETSD